MKKYLLLFITSMLFMGEIAFAQNITVKGTVTDATSKETLVGVSVRVKGSTQGTTTNASGQFTITALATDQLLISYVGYKTQTIPVGTGGIVDVKMEKEGAALGEVVVTGSRSKPRVRLETAVPVDLISVSKASATTGRMDLTDILNYAAPSFNYNKQSGSDGADHVELGTLRGLGPDQTLVLINGKRQHPTAFISVFGTRGRGASGVDMSSIPTAAIENVEVLRDGASAQYGSDAIAGVINIILKRNINQLTVNAGYSGYYDPTFNTAYSNIKGEYPHSGKIDGNEVTIDANYGLALGKKGFINFTVDYDGILDKTFRQAKIDPNAAMPNSLPLNIYRRANGDGTANMLNTFFNAEAPIAGSKTTFYAFGGYSYKGSDDYAWSRQSDSPEKFPDNTDGSLLVNYPGITHLTPEGVYYYNPIIQTHNTDITATAGFKGSWENNWDWDASNTFGNNVFHFYGDKTFNVGLQPNAAGIMQTYFDDGGSKFMQNTINFNVSKHFPSTFEGMNLGLGSEARFERYSIFAGEPASYLNYNVNKKTGAQGFPGFQPADTDIPNPNRSVYGVYADLETDFTKAFLLDAAARYEHYSDFGSSLNGKLAGRLKLTEDFNLRGSLSTGFRAPSLQQINFSNTFSNVTPTGSLLVKIVPNYSPVARAAGIPSLKQEKSQNYSLGFAWKPMNELSITVDGYIVKIKDRIVLTGQFSADDSTLNPALTDLLNSNGIQQAQFFANAVNTTNRGIDIVFDYNHVFDKNHLRFTLTGNLQHMAIDKINYPPLLGDTYLHRQTFYSDREQKFLLASAPNSKFSFNAEYGYDKFSIGTRLTYFGKIDLDGLGDDAIGFNDTATGSDTNATPISTNDAGTGTVPNVYIYSAKVITDGYISLKLSKTAKLSLGVDNIFNVHPSLSVSKGAVGYSSYNNEGGGPFDAVQMGENGRRGYIKIGLTF